YVKKDGSKIYVAVSDVLERNKAGDVIGIRTTMVDITKDKEAESALRKSEESYKNLVENAGVAILIDDQEGNFKYANERAARIFGYSIEEMKEQSIRSVVHPDDLKKVMTYHQGRLQNEKVPSRYEFKGIKKDGSSIDLEVSASELREEGNVIGTRSYLWDITERKRVVESLAKTTIDLSIRNTIAGIFLRFPGEDMFGEVLQVVQNAMESRYGSFAYLDEDGAAATLSMSRDVRKEFQIPDKSLRFPREAWGDSIWAKAILEKRSFYKNELGRIPSGHVPIENVLVVPILVQDTAIGNFEVANKKGGYDEEDKKYLEGIADFIAPLLGTRLQRDIQERKRKKAEEALREQEERYRILFDEALDGICLADTETGLIIDCNQALAALVGRERAELIGRPQRILHPPDYDQAAFSPTFKQHLTDKIGQILETQVVTSTGTIRDVEIKANCLNLQGRKLLQGVFRDITDRKLAEQALRKRNTQLELIHHIQSEIPVNTDIETVLVRAAESIGKPFGYYKISVNLYHPETEEIEYLTGWNKSGLLIPRGHRQKLGQGLIGKAGLLKQTIVANDVSKEPDYIPYHLTETKAELIIPLVVQDQLIGVLDLQSTQVNAFSEGDVSVLQAIASYIAHIIDEKKQREELRESEQKFKNLAEQTPSMIFINQKGRVVFANKKCEEIMGYQREEIYSPDFDFLVLIAPEDRDKIKANFAKHLRGEENPPLEYAFLAKEGKRIEALLATKLIDYGGEKAILGTITDITERKRAEKEVRLKELRLQSLLNISQHKSKDIQDLFDCALYEAIKLTVSKIGFFAFYSEENKAMTIVTWSRETMKECEVPDKSLVFPLENAGIWAEGIRRRTPFVINDYQAPHPNKRGCPTGHVELSRYLTIPLFSDDKITAVVAVANKEEDYDESDVRQLTLLMDPVLKLVESVRAEEELKKSEERFRLVFESAPDAYYLNDLKGNFIDGNKAAEKLTGYKREELVGMSFLKLNLLSAEFIPKAAYLLFKNLRNKSTGPDEFILKRKDGSKVTVEISTHPVRLEGKTVVLGIARDITERKKAEQALKENEEKYRTLTENVNIGVYRNTAGAKGRFLEANSALVKMFGYKNKKEFLALNVSDLYQNDAAREKFSEKMLRQGFVRNEETHLLKKDGKPIICSISAVAVKDEQGSIQYFDGTIEDITERKRAENALRENEMRYRALFECANDAVFLLSSEGKHVMVNKRAAEMLGYSIKDLIGLSYGDIVAPSEHKDATNKLQAVWNGESFSTYERIFRKKNGTEFPVEITIALISDVEGKPLFIQSVVRDITDRKRAEEDLTKERNLLRTLIDNLPDYIFIKDVESRFVINNVAHLRCLGAKTQDEVIGKADIDFFPNKMAEQYLADEREIIRSRRALAVREEPSIDRTTGDRKWLLTTKVPLVGANGRAVGLVGISRDITERKRAEEELSKHREHLEELVKARTGELEKAKIAADAANRAKSVFLANM
ncbi:MAG: PAS domain S-box protein, partial [Candidatus Aminicenantes bacterium]|nr:PAS domain S-box protein [Candidatus Aminicenantes bacterium]